MISIHLHYADDYQEFKKGGKIPDSMFTDY